ncbi:MAG TPA: 2-phosphosulfolactate phosphatase [Limnochordia bacterium]|nr:2-phosphosulfolactate phosphatase [Limnochordia bacterium]
MKIDVAFRAADVTQELVRGRIAVVIDVLRATTMIASLLNAGAREVWPVKEVEEARSLAARLDGALLAGERGGLPPPGFDMGNSPRDIDPARVAGAPVVITTTNGTAAIERAAGADALVTAAFVNAGAVAQGLLQSGASQLIIICAGTRGAFSLDDALCAGHLITRLQEGRAGVELTDSALAARLLYQGQREDLFSALLECAHGKVLQELGLKEDIELARRVDSIDLIPVRIWKDGRCVLQAAPPGKGLAAAP